MVNAFKGLGFTEQQIEDLFVEITDPKPPSYKTATELKAEKKGNQTGIRR